MKIKMEKAEEKENQTTEFPVMCECVNDNPGLVVLFFRPNTGVVVSPGKSNHPVGLFRTDFVSYTNRHMWNRRPAGTKVTFEQE
jgi:hypothetical protein